MAVNSAESSGFHSVRMTCNAPSINRLRNHGTPPVYLILGIFFISTVPFLQDVLKAKEESAIDDVALKTALAWMTL